MDTVVDYDDKEWLESSRYVTNQKRRNSCGCSVIYRQENISTNFRMVALAIVILFGLCTLLFSWNIVLSNQYEKLQDHVTLLTKTLEKYDDMMSSNNDVIATQKRNRHGNRGIGWEDYANEEEEEEVRPPRELQTERSSNFLVPRRIRRSSVNDGQESQSAIQPAPSLPDSIQTRVKRGGGRKRKKKKKGGRKGSRQPEIPQATAFHAKILGGDPPYKDQYLNTWDTNPGKGFINQGFDVRSINGNIDDGLVGVMVETSGFYYIYSQVVFKPFASGDNRDVTEKIMIGVTGNSEFSSCTTSSFRSLSSDDYVACHSSGIAYLRSGEIFRIKISPNKIQIYTNPSHTYFGAFLLGSQKR